MTQKTQPSGNTGRSATGRLLPFVLVAAALAAGLVLGGLSSDAPAEAAPGGTPVPTPQAARKAVAAPAGAANTIPRIKIDTAGLPTAGPAEAPITLVEFIDYQCPFCGRAHQTVNQVLSKYGDSVRVAFVMNPLSFHKDAPLAAQAALAANDQGKFLEMHNLLLDNQRALKRDNLVAYAGQIGLDVPAFEAALDSGRFTAPVQAGQQTAARIGATATPYFFVNGRTLRGAQPLPAFTRLIDEELGGKLKPTRWIARVETPKKQQRPAEDPNKRYDIDVADSIARGPANAPVTIVEFTDYQCPFCGRAQSTVQEILKAYPDNVRLVVKNMPLDFHGQARSAAVAAVAASKQDKYWEYRALLFANQRTLGEDKFVEFARQVGLDMDRWQADRKDPGLMAMVNRDVKQAAQVGVRGTPTFFVNGKKMVGAQPFTSFKAAIDANLKGSAAAAPATR
ncbi:MAG: DsbA family protein [Acidobacteriota bacterium]